MKPLEVLSTARRQVSVRLLPALVDAVEELAQAEHRTWSAMAERLLCEACDERTRLQPPTPSRKRKPN